MKLALGVSYNQLTTDNLRFARQCGATHLVVHLTDYEGINLSLPGLNDDSFVTLTNADKKRWSIDSLAQMQQFVRSEGLEIAAIENFDPGHWYDVLLGGPKQEEQLDFLKTIIHNLGEAGIPVIHYNFSIAGIWGWRKTELARGRAKSVAFDASWDGLDAPVPKGMVWNMYYDTDKSGNQAELSEEQQWSNLNAMLKALLPEAAKSGVRLAAHPEDPPVPTLRKSARLLRTPESIERLISQSEEPANALNFCLGTIQEMPGSMLYQMLERYLSEDRIAIVHVRNVKGRLPRYHETFPDEGDIDMHRVIQLLKKYKYNGIIMPDHTPEMNCDAPWHAGMAFSMGYLKALFQS